MLFIFRTFLDKPQDVVPPYLLPVLLYLGYVIGKAGTRFWIGITVLITVAFAVLYAFS